MADQDHVRLGELNEKNYTAQAKWFLNTMWPEMYANDEAGREQVWTWTANMIKLDKINGAKGTGLAEIAAHLFLEKNTESQTWSEFRDKMREIGFEHKNVSLLNFLIFSLKLDHRKMVNTVSGLDEEAELKIAEAEEKMQEAKDALDACVDAQAKASVAADAAAKALADQKVAEAEVKAGLEAIKAAEDKKNKQLAKLKARSEDESLGVVKKGKAFQEFKKLEGEDPLPLREAKIKQGAKVRKMKRATKACKKAENKAVAAREAAEKAVDDARAALEAAEAFIITVKQSCAGGTNDGILWWMDRELIEARKYLPKGKAAALARKVKQQKKKLGKKKQAPGTTTAAQSSSLMLEVSGAADRIKLRPVAKTEDVAAEPEVKAEVTE